MDEVALSGRDPLSFLDGPVPGLTAEITAPAPAATEPTPEPVAEEPKGPARGSDGKFVAATVAEPVVAETPAPPASAAVAEPTPAPTPAAPDTTAETRGILKALLAERDESKALKEELAALKAKAAPATPATPAPDVLDDPKGWQTALDERLALQRLEDRREWSKRNALKEHGAEVVEQVAAWTAQKCQAGIEGKDPAGFALNQQLFSAVDPFDVAITAWKADQRLSQVGTDFDEYLAWKAAKAAPQPETAAVVTTTAAPPAPLSPAPPKSLVTAPSAGGIAHVPSGPGQAYGRAFNS